MGDIQEFALYPEGVGGPLRGLKQRRGREWTRPDFWAGGEQRPENPRAAGGEWSEGSEV